MSPRIAPITHESVATVTIPEALLLRYLVALTEAREIIRTQWRRNEALELQVEELRADEPPPAPNAVRNKINDLERKLRDARDFRSRCMALSVSQQIDFLGRDDLMAMRTKIRKLLSTNYPEAP